MNFLVIPSLVLLRWLLPSCFDTVLVHHSFFTSTDHPLSNDSGAVTIGLFLVLGLVFFSFISSAVYVSTHRSARVLMYNVLVKCPLIFRVIYRVCRRHVVNLLLPGLIFFMLVRRSVAVTLLCVSIDVVPGSRISPSAFVDDSMLLSIVF